MPHFAANLTWLFRERPFLERFDAAAAAGFSAVECLFPYAWSAAELRQSLDRVGLRQVLLNAPPGDWDAGERGLAALPGRESEFEASLDQALEYAKALSCPNIHVMAGLAEPKATEAAEATYVESLKTAANRFAASDIRLLIEPINHRDMPGYILGSAAEARRLREKVGHDNLYLQLDLYHAQVTSGDLARLIEENLDWIGHIQIAGNPGRHEPDRGEINYPYLFALLDRLGYQGWIGCEYDPEGETVAGLTWGREFGFGHQGIEPEGGAKGTS